MSTVTTELDACLRERFGLDRFRPGQREVIETVLARRDCLCVMPTGGGKSLCYQLPSLLLDGVTLVVSPLIALMKDQVDGLVEHGIQATLVNSMVDTATQNERIAAMERGEYDLVYVAPERFRSARFNEAISRTRVALLAVDEAHCISEWGHDFRPDYTRLGRARRRLRSPPTIALTATATDHVRRDICEQLELADPKVFITGFDRPNLRYEVRYASSDAAKQQALGEAFQQTGGAGIIYCSSRKRCEDVAEFIRSELRRKSLVYHAGLLSEERRRAQDAFMNGRDIIVVATNAFGMGVDKPDIRFVIHYNIPGTIEAYYQEAGRAGRDGGESLCLMLYAPGDRYIQEFFIESEYPSREIVGKIYEFLVRQPGDPIEMTQEQVRERLNLDISDMGVGASLKLLEAAGALERLRPRENMAIVRIDGDVSRVALLPEKAKVQRKVLSALERLVAASPGDDTYFSPHRLAARLELEPTQFSHALHELCERFRFDYVPPFRGNAVRMLNRSGTLDSFQIDFRRLEERKNREYEKLEQVIAYAQSRHCRRRAILAYFGDRSPVQCGHCDNCESGKTGSSATLEANQRVTEIVRKILAGIARATGRGRFGFGKRIVAGMLVGRNIKAIKRWGLDKLSTFGLLQEFDEDEVVLLIESLIAAGWVHQEEFERFKPVISLTATGREVMLGERAASCAWRVPAALLAKLRQETISASRASRRPEPPSASFEPSSPDEPARSVDRELLKRLKAARDHWAAELQLPPYMVLANPVLEELARARPHSLEGLLNVKGIGPAKATRYGERLLELLGVAQPVHHAADSSQSQLPRRSPLPSDAREELSRRSPIPSGATGEGSGVRRESGAELSSSPLSLPAARGARAGLPDPQLVADSHSSADAAPSTGPSPEPSHGPPAYYWTWRLLERGFTQSECAIIRNIDEQTVLDHALQAARHGQVVPLDAFLPDELIEVVDRHVAGRPADQIASLTESLPDGISTAHVELCVRNRGLKSSDRHEALESQTPRDLLP